MNINKDTASVISALTLLASGVTLTFLAFFKSPTGDITDSVLWYMAQVLIYAGSVFGLKSYIDYRLKK